MQNIVNLDTEDVEHFWIANDTTFTVLCMAGH